MAWQDSFSVCVCVCVVCVCVCVCVVCGVCVCECVCVCGIDLFPPSHDAVAIEPRLETLENYLILHHRGMSSWYDSYTHRHMCKHIRRVHSLSTEWCLLNTTLFLSVKVYYTYTSKCSNKQTSHEGKV